MTNNSFQVVVVGAGIAGLRCAQVLQKAGIACLVIEKENQVGGRIKTRNKDGYLLDEGFQVLLDSYRELKSAVNLKALGLKAFDSGAWVLDGKHQNPIFNPLKHPEKTWKTLFYHPGSFGDLLKMGMAYLANQKENPDFWKKTNVQTMAAWLKEKGFSTSFTEGFLRPFFGGVFLDPSLELPVEYFFWLLGKFGEGNACLPTLGMGNLPKKMAEEAGLIWLEKEVQTIENQSIKLKDETTISFDWLVNATGNFTIEKTEAGKKHKQTTTLYLSGPDQTGLPNSLLLNALPDGKILHFCFPSAIQTGYAPKGKSLCSITLKQPTTEEEARIAWPQIISELKLIYPQVNWAEFSFLEVVFVPKALPHFEMGKKSTFQMDGNVLTIGDCVSYPSINGALRSGREAGEFLVKALV